MTSTEKVMLLSTSLDLLIAKLPVMENNVYNEVIKGMVKVRALMDDQGEDFVKTSIKEMGAVEIASLRDTVKKLQLTERVGSKLAKHFIKELDELLKFVDGLTHVMECMEAIFMIQLVKGYWVDSRGGEIFCGGVRADIEERFKVIQIIEEHASTMSVG